MKTAFYSYMLAEQLNVSPDDIHSINFRKKIPGRKANDKGVAVSSLSRPNDKDVYSSVKQMFGTDYGFGLFKYKACDFCDDVIAETADVVVGDAWLPEYMDKGHSLVVTRTSLMDDIIRNYTQSGELITDEVSKDSVLISQDASRHRKDTISYRLYLELKSNKWFPTKKFTAQ